jgi:hypothetical protein
MKTEETTKYTKHTKREAQWNSAIFRESSTSESLSILFWRLFSCISCVSWLFSFLPRERLPILAVAVGLVAQTALGQPPTPTRTPLLRVVDLNKGQSQEVALCDGTRATVKLLDVRETRDTLRGAIRNATVAVEVNGQRVELSSAMYHLPKSVAGVRIDCPVTKGYQANANRQGIWGLDADARLRLWPTRGPLVAPGTFGYPVSQRWFASDTQMANDPCYVDGGDRPGAQSVYYHYGLDFGGAERLVEVVAATDGIVVSAGGVTLPGYEETPVAPRYDVVYILDDRGWFYRYSHLHAIDQQVKPGRSVTLGQRVGLLGKEGGSGGWSHLHFDISSQLPSGKWGVQEGYALVWEAYQRQHQPPIIAVARPHHLAWCGDPVTLDATRSWSKSGTLRHAAWTFTDGTTATGPKVSRTYDTPGTYSEILKVTDDRGHVDYDFAVVQIVDKQHPDRLPPSIHATYWPTFGIQPGDEVTLKVRTFRTNGGEVWDFGDGSAPVRVKSDGNAVQHAKNGYAITTHRFQTAGHHIVRVEHTSPQGLQATTHLHVIVGP